MPRVLACVLFLVVLAGCGGSPITPTVTTAVMETPGPTTADETAYLEAVGATFHALQPLYDDLTRELDARTGSVLWQRQTQATIDAIRAAADKGTALQAPLRLQPLDQHFKQEMAHYRAALDTLDLTAVTPPPMAPFLSEMTAAKTEMDLVVKFLGEFNQLRSSEGS